MSAPHLTPAQLAAEDLLDALRDLVARDEAEAAQCGFEHDEMTWLDDARRVIALATGESQNDDLRLRNAARDLLEALEQAVCALNATPRFRVYETDSYKIASLCDRAIAKAKASEGGAS